LGKRFLRSMRETAYMSRIELTDLPSTGPSQELDVCGQHIFRAVYARFKI